VQRAQVDPSAPGAEGFDPAAAGVDYAAHVAWLQAQGLQVVDPLAALEAVDGPAFFARDHHWRPEGAAAVAERIAAHVRALPGGDTLPQTAFDRKVTGTLPRRGALLKQVEALCGAQGVPDESSETSVRVARGGAVDAAALFGDAPATEVVVVGDSNVNKGGMDAFDFAGALRSALGTEVLNVGVDGGGLYPPMQAFLASDEFRDQPPRFLVWVVGAHLRLADPNRLRQTVPLVGGDCSAAVARGSATLEKGASKPALSVPPGATASGSWAVSVHPRDPAALRVRVHLSHDGGKPDRAVVVRSARVGVGEPVLVALDPRRGPLRAVAVEPLLGASGEVDVALCPVR
jgi:alginate biosynthesis protein AlgX